MKILIFNSDFSKKNILGWSSFINSFKKTNLTILTETSSSKKFLIINSKILNVIV